MINIINEINDYFKIPLHYLARNKLSKFILGSAKRSGKSYGVAHLLVYLMITEGYHVLALRKNSSKLRESVWTEIMNVIFDWGLQAYFKVNASPADMRITYLPYGNQAIFKGVHSGSADKQANAASLGSFNFFSLTSKKIAPKMVAWFEEAYEFLDQDIQTTIMSYPTFTKIITLMTFNNWSSIPKVVKDLDKYAPGDVDTLEKEGIIWNYVNNDEHYQTLFMRTSAWMNLEHLNQETIAEFKAMKIYDYRAYKTIVLGMSGSGGDVAYTSFNKDKVAIDDGKFKQVLIQKFGAVIQPEYYRIGIDFGRKKDDNAFVFKKCYGYEQEIMFVDRTHAWSNKRLVHKKDTIGIAEEAIKFILQCVKENPLIKVKNLIVQVDSSAEGLYDILYRQINDNFLTDWDGDLLSEYCYILESWKPKVMSRLQMDNFLFGHNRYYIHRTRAAKLIEELENIKLDVDPKGRYFRIDEADHCINAWEYTNTRDDRRKQLGGNKILDSIQQFNIDINDAMEIDEEMEDYD